MARLVKNSGRYYLVDTGVYIEITDVIEAEIKARLDLERRLADYNQHVDSRVHFRLAATTAQLTTARNHLRVLLGKAESAFDAWAKGGNLHGSMIAVRPYLSIVQKWLDDSKGED